MKRYSIKIKCNYGFTLVELIVVVALIGIITAIALPTFTGTYNKYKINSVVKQVISDIRLTQYNAVSSSNLWKIEFVNSNTYKIYQIDSVGNPINSSDTITKKINVINVNLDIPQNNPSYFVFGSDGSISGLGGEIIVLDSISNKANSITVDKITGFVDIK